MGDRLKTGTFEDRGGGGQVDEDRTEYMCTGVPNKVGIVCTVSACVTSGSVL